MPACHAPRFTQRHSSSPPLPLLPPLLQAASPTAADAGRQQAPVVLEGGTSYDEEAVRLRRELDVRTAFSGLPRIAPQESHRWVGGCERESERGQRKL